MKTVIAVIAFTAGLVLAPTTTEIVHHVETIVQEQQTAPAEADVILQQLRKVDAITPTLDEHLLYECALTLQQHTGDSLGLLLAYTHAEWEGDTCAALTHYLDHRWY